MSIKYLFIQIIIYNIKGWPKIIQSNCCNCSYENQDSERTTILFKVYDGVGTTQYLYIVWYVYMYILVYLVIETSNEVFNYFKLLNCDHVDML